MATNQQRISISIRDYPIRLGQFLKLAEITNDGLEAKILITEGMVLVNGVVDTRRGKQLSKGDLVEYNGRSYLCC